MVLGVGKRTQFTSNIWAAANDLQPLKSGVFTLKLTKHAKINCHNCAVSTCGGDLRGLRGAAVGRTHSISSAVQKSF